MKKNIQIIRVDNSDGLIGPGPHQANGIIELIESGLVEFDLNRASILLAQPYIGLASQPNPM